MKIRAGDWVMSGPVEGREKLFQRGIQLMGSVHTHDELVGVRSGQLVVGNAHTPHFELTPFATRLAECERGERVMAVFRWHSFVGRMAHTEMYSRFRFGASAALHLMADLQLPYDKRAIVSHGRNWIRKRLPFLGPLSRHVEYHVFCTEGCFAVYRVLGIDVDQLAGFQPLVAPIHAERLYFDRYLLLVEDYGLIERLEAQDNAPDIRED